MSIPIHWFHAPLRRLFPEALWTGDPTRRELALTFDDGPHPESTPHLLAQLERLDIRATFFQVGRRAAAAPHLTRALVEAGHQVGLHGLDHRSFLLRSPGEVLEELAAVQALLAEATGRDPVTFRAVRPPYGHFTPALLNALLAAGYVPTMWSIVPLHWLQPAEETIRQVLQEARGGDLLVLHESLPGPPVTALTDAILPPLLAEGYRFVTIDTMWAARYRA